MSKSPSEIDQHVGRRVRARRIALEISQEQLADQLGLSFQQVQKYEKGINRIGASRLFEISRVLGVSIQYFFDEVDMPAELEAANKAILLRDFVTTSEGAALCSNFLAIASLETRMRLIDLVETIARNEVGSDGGVAPSPSATNRRRAAG